MSQEYISLGEPLAQLTEDALTISTSRQMFRACKAHRAFELVELRIYVVDEQRIAEILIIDCTNDGVPTQNEIGILYQERLGLVFYDEETRMPEVRALRKDFPATLHQNFVNQGQPASLCLYFDTWEGIQRYWTPQSHLNRILWWLAETAKGSLHREDQPVEPFYFSSHYEIILPPDFDEKIHQHELVLVIKPIQDKFFFGYFDSVTKVNQHARVGLLCLTIVLPPVVHARIERFPYDLDTLEKQLSTRGVDLFSLIYDEIKRRIGSDGVSKTENSKVLLILQIPIQRSNNATIERNECKAFYLDVNFGTLGEAFEILVDAKDGKCYQIPLFGPKPISSEAWRSISIEPVEVSFSLTTEMAQQMSGIEANTSDFRGILAGVGALGSALAEIWNREAWGVWTFVDPDYIKTHNVARSNARNFQVTQFKADAVKQMIDSTFFEGYIKASAIVDSVINWSNDNVLTAVENADLIIDATTTLEVPRSLAIAHIKRAASVFLTPSGYDSVLIIEDSERNIRLNSLEAQYYEAILNEAWGENHLSGHQGHLWIGAGCRDVSNVISFELIQIHAATLARQIRLKRESPEPRILMWRIDSQSGSVSANDVSVSLPITVIANGWQIIWNVRLRDKARETRSIHLPSETGGVLLGYMDHKLKTIFVVDILPAPSDSEADKSGFTRGSKDLEETILMAQARTANIVSYIGEWHSHPAGSSTEPSDQDILLLSYLTEALHHEGHPSVMLIVGENGETWSIGEYRSVL
jgi:integrative and conjugative element protein (TIGR02256 family)